MFIIDDILREAVHLYADPFWLTTNSTLISWCEREFSAPETRPFRKRYGIREPSNTLTNAFYIILAIFGLIRNRRGTGNFVIWFSDLVLIVVGIGSWMFHSRPCLMSELADELPMVLFGYTYVSIAASLPRIKNESAERKSKREWRLFSLKMGFFFINIVAAILYTFLGFYDLFQAVFAVNVLCAISYSLWIVTRLGRESGDWVFRRRHLCAVLAIGTGKVIWETEQWQLRNGKCETNPRDFRYHLHGMWHLLSAMAHRLWVDVTADVLRWEKGSGKTKSM